MSPDGGGVAANETITSHDGTRIALSMIGTGPPVVLIGGAYNDRSTVAGLAAVLAPRFTAIAYDRRGRGDSGDNSAAPDAFNRNDELDDLAAVIRSAGGSARIFGHSSGAVMGLEAAHRGLPIDRLAVYETPYVLPAAARPRPGEDLLDRLITLVRDGRRDDAVALFQTEAIGLPAEMVERMRQSDVWAWLVGLAHTLPYDVALFDPGYWLPTDRLGTIQVPTLAIAGTKTDQNLFAATKAVAGAIPGARFTAIEGEDHAVLQRPEALRQSLFDFLG